MRMEGLSGTGKVPDSLYAFRQVLKPYSMSHFAEKI